MNKNPYLLPMSIVLAGIIIAGAVLYQPGERQAATALNVKPLDYVELAGDLGMDKAAFKTCFDTHEFKTEIEKDAQAGSDTGVSGTPTSFINGTKVEGAQPYSVYKDAIENALKDPSAGALSSVLVSADDDAVLGDANAPVTMIIFGDFECPFCEQAYRTSEKQVRDEYVATGKVKMVFRDYPLSFHAAAQPAAEASECAHAQGKYWEYHDALFDAQDRLPQS